MDNKMPANGIAHNKLALAPSNPAENAGDDKPKTTNSKDVNSLISSLLY